MDVELLLFREISDSDKMDFVHIRFLIGQLQRGEKEIVFQTTGMMVESLLKYQ